MKELLDAVKDSYNRRARLQPALIVALPLALAVFSWSPDGLKAWTALWSLFVWAGGTALMTQLARDRGRKMERALYESWGEKPTTRLLRYAGSDNSVLVTRRHNSLQKALPDLHIPSEAEEASDPSHSDHVYDTCVRWLLEQTRDTKKFALIFEENCNYGFRRNLLGMKRIGIGVASVSIIAGLAGPVSHVATGSSVSPVSYGAVACILCLLLFWLLACNSNWVKLAADAFAERLLAASEVLSPAKASPAPRATKAPKKPKET